MVDEDVSLVVIMICSETLLISFATVSVSIDLGSCCDTESVISGVALSFYILCSTMGRKNMKLTSAK